MKVAIHTVGICGSDVHYYTHGGIGSFRLNEPMVLGHEAFGTVVEVGSEVENFVAGDRVCMEPGVPDLSSRASKLGRYNVDPSVVFWATPPVHGVLTPLIVHPAAFTYKLPSSVSFAEGAMVEPFATGLQAAARARIVPGDVAAVIGCGPIDIMTAVAALAGGCSRVYVSDFSPEKLAIAGRYQGIYSANASRGRRSVGGLPVQHAAICKEVRIETVMRYANVFDRALSVISTGKVDLKPLISDTYSFDDAVQAFERAAPARPSDVKIQIRVCENEI
ncbi:D-xylulose reductase [Sinorhizobium meliloti]